MDAQEYERIKQKKQKETDRARKILLACAGAVIVILIIIVSSIVGFFNDPQRAIAKESKSLLKQAEQLVDEGNYASAVDVLDQINREWDDYSTTTQIRQEAERGVMLEKISEYQKSGNYEALVAYVDSKISNVESDTEVYEVYATAKQKVKEKLLAEMVAYMSAGDYFGAIQYFHKAGDSLANDSEAVTVYNNAVAAYADAVIQEAEAHAQAGDYASAQAVLSTAQNYIGWVTDLADKAYELDVREVSEEAKAYVNVGNYKDAILYMNDHLDVVYGNPDLEAKLSTYIEKYRTSVLSEATNAYKSSGYEAAIDVLNTALKVLEYDNVLLEEVNKYEEAVPVSLIDIECVKKGEFAYVGREEKLSYNSRIRDDMNVLSKDVAGNTYPNDEIHFILHYYSQNTDADNSESRSFVYFLNQQYDILTGVLYRPYATLSCDFEWEHEGKMEVYGDGTLIYSASIAQSDYSAIRFNVKVTGVRELKIRLSGTWRTDDWDYGWFNPKICVAELKVAKEP